MTVPAEQVTPGALDGLVAAAPGLESITVVAHSYGGTVAAVTAQARAPGPATELHLVAAPLGAYEPLQKLCGFEGVPDAPPAYGIAWRQWRTDHASDGAFKDLEVDPQVVDLPELTGTALPAERDDGERLGHNRAVVWVAEALVAEGG